MSPELNAGEGVGATQGLATISALNYKIMGGSHAAQEHVTTGIVENGKKEEFRAVSA